MGFWSRIGRDPEFFELLPKHTPASITFQSTFLLLGDLPSGPGRAEESWTLRHGSRSIANAKANTSTSPRLFGHEINACLCLNCNTFFDWRQDGICLRCR